MLTRGLELGPIDRLDLFVVSFSHEVDGYDVHQVGYPHEDIALVLELVEVYQVHPTLVCHLRVTTKLIAGVIPRWVHQNANELPN